MNTNRKVALSKLSDDSNSNSSDNSNNDVIRYFSRYRLDQKLPILFLVNCVEDRPQWPLQSPNEGRKRKSKGQEEREIRSSLLISDLKVGKL